jgi:hypothetical protein
MSYGKTIIKYNDVVLTDVLTKEFRQDVKWSDDGHTMLYHKFTIVAQGYFVSGHPDGWIYQTVIPAVIPTVDIEKVPRSGLLTATERYAFLSDNLTAHRKKFEMRVGVTSTQQGELLLYAHPRPDAPVGVIDRTGTTLFEYYDRNDGPRVSGLTIDQLTAETYRVNVTFEICLRPFECDPASEIYHPGSADGLSAAAQRVFGVICNRWSCADNIDETRAVTRRWQGQITLSDPRINPHEFRWLCLPPLDEGMQRTQMEFVASEDNLKFRYVIQDEERTVSPIGMGTDATDTIYMKVRQSDSIMKFGTHVITNFDIYLKGTVRTNRLEMARMAAVYADAKLDLATFIKPLDDDGKQKVGVIVESYTLEEAFDSHRQNEVKLSMKFRRIPDKDNGGIVGMITGLTNNFGNEVRGADMEKRTTDPIMKNFLRHYDHFQSWGNRLWNGDRPDETGSITGTHKISAAIAVALQNECTLRFDMCNGTVGAFSVAQLAANPDYNKQADSSLRVQQLKESRDSCPTNIRLTYGIRRTLPDLKSRRVADADRDGMMTHHRSERTHSTEQLGVALPIASALPEPYTTGQSYPTPEINSSSALSSFVRVGPAQHVLTISIEATREGRSPTMPKIYEEYTDSDGVGHMLISQQITPSQPEINGNMSSRQYTLRAVLKYAMTHAPKKWLTGISPTENPQTRDSITGELVGYIDPFVLSAEDLFDGDIDYYVPPA